MNTEILIFGILIALCCLLSLALMITIGHNGKLNNEIENLKKKLR